ncbi:serine/threonine-protein kinase WNK4-like [Schistocerca americana]|uniref:serine/threonine-protein kinase WNK4-like n=2 Tax=Schistocerca TaxID=7008 RepID=UPI001F4FEA1A|nr:serine/threonine-protein kinase WNK4-like [Schistocerca americana]
MSVAILFYYGTVSSGAAAKAGRVLELEPVRGRLVRLENLQPQSADSSRAVRTLRDPSASANSMILPPQSATAMPAGRTPSLSSSSSPSAAPCSRARVGGGRPVVQWRRRHVREGLLVIDEAQLARLIKRQPIHTLYQLDPEPFATGQFASVWRCRSRETGQVFAAKFSSRTRYGDDCSAEIRHEIALLSLCAPSPRIVRLHDVFETDNEIIIVLEYAPGGDLQTIIDDNLVPFESDVVKFVRQLLEGLVYLHERRIAHLDIKPQNLVMMSQFPDCDVKLCDFEISRVVVEGAEIRELLGTPDYVAPEILHYEPITLAADMWSLGVTTYVLLTGFSPFGGETDQETFCNISGAQLDFPEELFEDVSEAAQDFIRRLLVRDPRARPTAKECLRHRWFTGSKVKVKARAKDSGGLRKYLSKSREALFERVVQQRQQQQQQGSCQDLRRRTLLSQQRRRLCESHASLLAPAAASRARALADQPWPAPALSRSREKLYGLRSLSRSSEALALPLPLRPGCRSLLDLCGAALSRQPSSASLDNCDDVNSNVCSRAASPAPAPVPAPADLTNSNVCSRAASPAPADVTNSNVYCDAPSAEDDLLADVPAAPTPEPPAVRGEWRDAPADLTSPALLRNCLGSAVSARAAVEAVAANSEERVDGRENGYDSNPVESEDIPAAEQTRTADPQVEDLDKVHRLKKSGDDEMNTSYSSGSDGEDGGAGSSSSGGGGGGSSSQDDGFDEAEEDEEEGQESEGASQEPRFTVAQLVSAFTRHERAVAGAAPAPEAGRFPTGPNALRLFIPGISIRRDRDRDRDRQRQRRRHGRQEQGEKTTSPEEQQSSIVSKTGDQTLITVPADYDRLQSNSGVSDQEVSKKSAGGVSRNGDSLERTSAFCLDHDTNNNRNNKCISNTNGTRSSSWERICTGSYTRAMDKFRPTRKSLTAISEPPVQITEKVRRKSTPAIKNVYL